jgi:serine/threonine protein phosphatase 1
VFANLFRKASPAPATDFAVEAGTRIYAIGDVHGRADLLARVVERIHDDVSQHDGRRVLLVFLGDYVDRGPDSRLVLEMLLALCREPDVVCLCGNHEMMLLRFLRDPAIWESWAQMGGAQTLLSYGVRVSQRLTPDDQIRAARDFAAAIPQGHLRFLENLPLVYESGTVLFVHAGVRPQIPLHRQAADDLLWIREPFLTFRGSFGRLVIHGHSPVEQPEIRPNRINIDTGAYATGRLTCLVLDGSRFTLL